MNTDSISTLMLLDDNAIDQMLYKKVIDRSGLVDSLIQCLSAEEALAILRKGQFPDAILLDINMPRIDGFEFLETAVKEFGDEFSVVVVMLTTSLNPEDSDKAATYAVVKDYFNKPLQAEQLHRVAQLVNQSASKTSGIQ